MKLYLRTFKEGKSERNKWENYGTKWLNIQKERWWKRGSSERMKAAKKIGGKMVIE